VLSVDRVGSNYINSYRNLIGRMFEQSTCCELKADQVRLRLRSPLGCC
jgi:hypothetical protein